MNSVMQSSALLAGVFLVGLLFMSGCGQEKPSATTTEASAPEKPKPFDPMALEITDPQLVEGRDLWVPRCGQCHISGLGGAPKIGDKQAWVPRIAQGKETLYAHAIDGFSGPKMLIMPPKGGFDELTDEQVKLCVDFVVFASQ